MLKKKLVFIGLLFTLVICPSFLTHAQAAQENAGSDLEVADEAEFEEIMLCYQIWKRCRYRQWQENCHFCW